MPGDGGALNASATGIRLAGLRLGLSKGIRLNAGVPNCPTEALELLPGLLANNGKGFSGEKVPCAIASAIGTLLAGVRVRSVGFDGEIRCGVVGSRRAWGVNWTGVATRGTGSSTKFAFVGLSLRGGVQAGISCFNKLSDDGDNEPSSRVNLVGVALLVRLDLLAGPIPGAGERRRAPSSFAASPERTWSARHSSESVVGRTGTSRSLPFRDLLSVVSGNVPP